MNKHDVEHALRHVLAQVDFERYKELTDDEIDELVNDFIDEVRGQ